MKRFIFTIIVAAAFLSAGAQSLKTFYVNIPENANPEVDQIFVTDFVTADPSKETAVPEFGKNLTAGIQGEIRNSERYGNVEFIPPSWRRTDIYEVADDEAGAQWVITGTFDIQTDSKRDVKTEIKAETGTANLHNIPFEVIYFDYMNSANTKVTMELKDKQGNVIVTYEKEKAAESHPKRDMRDPSGKLESHAALVNSTRQFFVTDMANQFLPWMKPFVYEFVKIKNGDMKDHVSKDRYKELKKMMREDSDLAKKLDYYGLGQLYKTVAEETGLEDAKVNMAYVYEVLGNFTRAREIFEELGRTKDIERVDIFIAKRDKLATFGKDFFEPEI